MMIDWDYYDFDKYLLQIIANKGSTGLIRQLGNDLIISLENIQKWRMFFDTVKWILYILFIFSMITGLWIPSILIALCFLGMNMYYCGDLFLNKTIPMREKIGGSLPYPSLQYLDMFRYIHHSYLDNPEVDVLIQTLIQQPEHILESLFKSYQDSSQNALYLSRRIINNMECDQSKILEYHHASSS